MNFIKTIKIIIIQIKKNFRKCKFFLINNLFYFLKINIIIIFFVSKIYFLIKKSISKTL